MLLYDTSKFENSEEADEEVLELNQKLIDLCQKEYDDKQKWWDIGAEAYRIKRAEGKTAFPTPTLLPNARTSEIPSRDEGRAIKIRYFVPEGKIKGVYLHIHGGGWVLSSYNAQDPYLNRVALESGLLAVSIEYRLSPEHPSPAAQEDCIDVAKFLFSPMAASVLPLRQDNKNYFIGGESAGGHLTALTILAMRDLYGQSFRGAIFNYGVFDLSMTPSAHNAKIPLVLNNDDMINFRDAYVPSMKLEELRSPHISPLFAQLDGLCPALFICGTADCLLDDSLFMTSRYMAAGNKDVELKLFKSAPHGFITMNCKQATQGIDVIVDKLKAWL